MTNERTENLANLRRAASRAPVRLVFVGVVANALTQFAIQAWMSYRFARDVWAIPQPLCVAVIAALDLFAVMFMIFTYLLRTAKWPTRMYVWLVFAAGVGAQLFAAELYGAHEHWTSPVRVFAGLPALFLAASLHGLIIWRNHGGPATESPATRGPARKRTLADAHAAPAEPAEESTPEKPRGPQPKAPRRGSGRAKPGRAGHPLRPVAIKRVLAGEDTAVVAADLKVSRRSVQIWVSEIRKGQPGSEPIPDLGQRLNGAEPAIEVGA